MDNALYWNGREEYMLSTPISLLRIHSQPQNCCTKDFLSFLLLLGVGGGKVLRVQVDYCL